MKGAAPYFVLGLLLSCGRAPETARWPLPEPHLEPTPEENSDDPERIPQLIRTLADVDEECTGVTSGATYDTNFAAVRQTSAPIARRVGYGPVALSKTLRDLVAIGPRALPYLLNSLDDATPTCVSVNKRGRGICAITIESRLPAISVGTRESAIASGLKLASPRELDSYGVKIGDLCFVALGQIVNRQYEAVSYRPTGCVVVNSPVESPSLRDALRSLWGGREPSAMLLRSLSEDYARAGIFNGDSLDGWDDASECQAGAAMRLLYYFPEQSEDAIIARLDTLDVKDRGADVDAYVRREVGNGIRPEHLVGAVAWCNRTKIAAAIHRIYERTNDLSIRKRCRAE